MLFCSVVFWWATLCQHQAELIPYDITERRSEGNKAAQLRTITSHHGQCNDGSTQLAFILALGLCSPRRLDAS